MPKHTHNKKMRHGRPVWQNSIKTMEVVPQQYFEPHSLGEIEHIVQQAIDHGAEVRAVGSGHSFSDAPRAPGYLIDMDHLDKVEKYAFSDNDMHFEVECGIKIRDLNRLLDKEYNLAISTMGGIDHQSISGAVSTGTHGSSLDFGAISKMVKSMVLVTHDLSDPMKVETLRIEPKNGPTIEAGYQGPRLIKDDDLFNSALVSFGTMGIIYSLVVEAEPLFYLQETKVLLDWPELKAMLQEEKLFEDQRSVFTLTNPYHFEGQRLSMIAYHKEVPDSSRKSGKFWRRIKRLTRSFAFHAASIFPFAMWWIVYKINSKPESVRKLLHSALKSQRDEVYINKGYKVTYQGLDYVKERGCDCEMSVEMDSEGKYLDLVEELMDFLEEIHQKYKLQITSPVGLRFVKESDAHMTPESGRRTCYIDLPILVKTLGRETTVSLIQKFLMDRGARPHWGKLNKPLTVTQVEKLYPDYQKFKVNVEKYNPHHLFSNTFSRRVISW